MKKLFLNLFVVGAIMFGMQSCKDKCDDVTCETGQICEDGDCISDPNYICDVCGTYTGTASGNVAIQLTGTDTTFVGIPLTATITHVGGSTHNMAVDISSLLGASPGTLVPDVDGSLNGTVMTITDQTYNYSGVANITINGDANFNNAFTSVEGNLDLTNNAVGAITFVGNK